MSIAAGLAERGHRTLLIDLDAQGNVGVSLGINGQRTLYHVLIDGVRPEDAAVPVRNNLDIITSDQTVAAAELELVNARSGPGALAAHGGLGRAEQPLRLHRARLRALALAPRQNALTFARDVIVPVSCDYLALVGVKQILRTLRHVNEVLLHPIEVLGVVSRRSMTFETASAKRRCRRWPATSRIAAAAHPREHAPQKGEPRKSIFEYDPESTGAPRTTARSRTGWSRRRRFGWRPRMCVR
ncbi:MAG: AAA family ATPase [Myxococcota bacterium]